MDWVANPGHHKVGSEYDASPLNGVIMVDANNRDGSFSSIQWHAKLYKCLRLNLFISIAGIGILYIRWSRCALDNSSVRGRHPPRARVRAKVKVTILLAKTT